MNFILYPALIIALIYAALVGLMAYNQRSFVFPAPTGPGAEVPGFERVQYQTEDGLTLASGYRAGEAGMPTILYFHGNGADWQSSVVATDQLVPAGYGVLAAEYRGYRDNPGSRSEEGLYADARAAAAWLGEQGVAPDQIVIIGNSIGGGAATQLATEINPRALVLISTFTSLPDVAAEKIWWAPTRLLLRDEFANIDKIASVSAPILLLHGDADTLIHDGHSRALSKANPAAKLRIVPDAGHELAWSPEAEIAVLSFLQVLKD